MDKTVVYITIEISNIVTPMKDITFNTTKGEVSLIQHHGAGNGYHLYLNNFYQGQFVVRNSRWVWLNANTTLHEKEINIIIDVIKIKQ